MAASEHQWDVVGIGENSVDVVTRLPGWPRPGGALAKMRIREQLVFCGGQVATTLATCARLGLRVKYVSTIGNDHNARLIRQELARHHIDLSDVIVHNAPNRSALILVDETTGDRVVLWHRDDRLALRADDLPLHAIRSARAVHLDDVDADASMAAARAARDAGAIVTCDVDRATDVAAALVAAVTHPVMAEHLPAQLTGISDARHALHKLRQPHHKLLCVTQGERGAMALDGDRLVQVPAVPVRPIDTTGAGDVFRGAFIYGVLQKWSTAETLRFACAAAAVSCTRLGALNGVPSIDEVRALLAHGAAT